MFVRSVKLWIILSALASLAGWILSSLGMLNLIGYLAFAAAFAVLALIVRKSFPACPVSAVRDLRKLRKRLRSFFPAAFAILAALVFISGVLYAPNDHTGLSYRLPRTLQWLSHGHWFWIRTPNYRMNDRACGIEWLSAPLLLFLRSDRALFLLNFIPFVLMPGLIFSVWTRLGVRPRVAWNWMWLVPTGYCFLIQAGGIANDAFPSVYALAMIDLALRARSELKAAGTGAAKTSAASWNLCLSLLSAALLVGTKASNLPLGLPWAILFFPLVPRIFGCGKSAESNRNTRQATRKGIQLVAWSLAVLTAIVISFIPSALLNIHYLHDWSGLSIEHAGMNMKNPVAGVLGNGVLLFTSNFVPTFFPMAGWWSQHALSHFPGVLVRLMDANFEGGYNSLGEMPTEDWSGLGFGVSVLVVVSLIAGWCVRNPRQGTRYLDRVTRLVLIAPWISLLAYCAKTGMVTPARLIAPYYPLLLPLLLVGAAQSHIVRRSWWRLSAVVTLLLALAALVLTPPRPLWPAQSILSKLVAAHPNQRELSRAQKVYEVYGHRSDPLGGMRQWFPPGLKTIGFMGTDDDLDISLWKPYGSRRVEPFFEEDSPEKVHELGIEYAVVSGLELSVRQVTIDDWLQKSGAELLATTNATMTVSQGVEPWYFVRFKE